MTRYTYTAYGLQVECSFPLPELSASPSRRADVCICYGEVADSLPHPQTTDFAWLSTPGQMLLSVKKVARYLIVENREIRVHAFPGTTEAEVRIFLLGSVLGALLHARQMLVLHASVIQTPRGAVLFMGRSGAGKSTLLGAFLQRGYAMLADDKAGIRAAGDGTPQVMPGFPLVRLTEDAANQLRYPVRGAGLHRSLGKYVLPVSQFCANPLPLHAAYLLAPQNRADICLEPLESVRQFQVLNSSTYRRRFLQQADQRLAHFRMLEAASHQARVTRVLRPVSGWSIDELTARIEEDMLR
jgi:hypothetical protein